MNYHFSTKEIVINVSKKSYELGFLEFGAWVICELWKYVNHKSKFTEKSCEPGSQKFGSRNFFFKEHVLEGRVLLTWVFF
jgi:hypothetical protein